MLPVGNGAFDSLEMLSNVATDMSPAQSQSQTQYYDWSQTQPRVLEERDITISAPSVYRSGARVAIMSLSAIASGASFRKAVPTSGSSLNALVTKLSVVIVAEEMDLENHGYGHHRHHRHHTTKAEPIVPTYYFPALEDSRKSVISGNIAAHKPKPVTEDESSKWSANLYSVTTLALDRCTMCTMAAEWGLYKEHQSVTVCKMRFSTTIFTALISVALVSALPYPGSYDSGLEIRDEFNINIVARGPDDPPRRIKFAAEPAVRRPPGSRKFQATSAQKDAQKEGATIQKAQQQTRGGSSGSSQTRH
ncbi:hypothetical protein C8J56DRAFT_895051 [Mycena floridula]|nr:hypothetical protein C8J56DRAFT_895051 [Mycena floridula]